MKKILVVGAACILLTGLLLACTTQNLAEQKAQAVAIRNLGEEYLKHGKIRMALKELKKAEALTPDDHLLQDDLGLCYYFLNDQDQAIFHFKKSLEIKEDYTPARNNLGNAYAEKKEWDKAIEQYKIVTEDLLKCHSLYLPGGLTLLAPKVRCIIKMFLRNCFSFNSSC